MALQDLLALSQSRDKIGLSEERINAIIPVARQYISFWREYPDIFIDFLSNSLQSDKLLPDLSMDLDSDNQTIGWFLFL